MKDLPRPQVRFFCCPRATASGVFTQPRSQGVIQARRYRRLAPNSGLHVSLESLLFTERRDQYVSEPSAKKNPTSNSVAAPLRLCFGSTMAKIDRIPDAWPALMSDVMAARYLDFSVSFFRALVDSGKLPRGQEVWESDAVRWRRSQLDAAINLEFGLPAHNASSSAVAGGDEWMDALRAN